MYCTVLNALQVSWCFSNGIRDSAVRIELYICFQKCSMQMSDSRWNTRPLCLKVCQHRNIVRTLKLIQPGFLNIFTKAAVSVASMVATPLLTREVLGLAKRSQYHSDRQGYFGNHWHYSWVGRRYPITEVTKYNVSSVSCSYKHLHSK